MKSSQVPPSACENTRPAEKRPPTVYLIDDDDAVRDSLTILLESYGMDVRAYESCAEFLAGYLAGPNSCLVLDHHLPTMSGLDLLESRAPAQLRLPVVMISGRVDPAIKARALAAGALVVLDKPFEDKALLAAIARALTYGSGGSASAVD
jgi:two-component system, LuxR family, response regulator FixJ